jgi:serine/threonine-protein kinase
MPDPAPDTPNAPSTRPGALREGDKVDPYTIVQQIGSGGNSVVFKAVDDLLAKKVAIKQFLFADIADDARLREKIMTEARLHQEAATADPERLVQVVDVVDSPHGLLLINEYISGPSLEQILAQNADPMDVRQALGIIAATAQALDAIHGKGIVHLDLKPANILMPRSGGLKISDFGLATNIAEQSPPTAGTVRYMSPERLRDEKVDGRADLYSLGVMAYEMLAGRAVFDQAFKLILRDQRNQAVRWVKWHTNPRTKAPPLTDLVPDLPQTISDLVQRLMAKDTDERVGSAKDLLSAIKRHFAGKDTGPAPDDTGPTAEVPAQATTPGDTAALPSRGGKMKYVVIAAVAAVVLAVGAGLFVIGMQRAERERVLGEALQVMEQAQAAYRDGRYEEALGRFSTVEANEAVREAYGRHARAGMLLSQGRIDAGQARYDEAIAAFTQAGESGDPYRDRARVLIEDAPTAQIGSLISNRSFGEARKELDAWRGLAATDGERQTLRALGARLEDQLARYRVQALIAEAEALVRDGRRDEAIALLENGPQKLEVTDLLAGLEIEATAEQAIALAEAALDRGDPEEAIFQYEQAVAAQPDNEALKGRLTDVRSDWLVEEGLRMLAQGNTVGADQMLTEALGYRPDNQKARDALAQIASSNRRQAFIEAGDAAAANGDYDTALRQYENALDLGVDDPLGDKLTGVRVQVLLKQSRAALEAGQIDRAGELVSEAGQIDPADPDVAAVRREVQVRGEYVRHLNAGDEARGRSAFGDAKRHYLRAKEAMDTPQIRARLDETEFDHLLAQARDFMAAEEYASARAQLQIAAGIKTTDEVRELIDQVNAADPATSP